MESYQKQLAPQAAKLQELSAQLSAQDTELVGGMSTLVALRRQVGGSLCRTHSVPPLLVHDAAAL